MIRLFFQVIVIGAVIGSFLTPLGVLAQESQILSVTPPLFQLSAVPGDIWQSSVKVVNGNNYPITVYAEVVNFKATGEAGQGKFIPVENANPEEKLTLAEWIEIAKGPHTIPAEETKDISFILKLPETTPPGGHYAAILVTTQPPANDEAKMAVHASQAVTSLFFVRIEGDVVENGTIREFRVIDALVDRPNAEFSMRFENKGNVHLQPRGDIVITNMWGTVRGTVPINNQTHFGNVLPESIRDFKFTWQSDFNITDIGRYKAFVTLAYGDSEIKSVSSATYFWVIPIKATLITLIVLATFVWLIVWMVRMYVRRMLTLAGVHVDTEHAAPAIDRGFKKATPVAHSRVQYKNVSAPLKDGVLDLRQRLSTVEETADILTTLWSFVATYKMFFISVFVLIVMFVVGVLYAGKATEEHTRYSVTIEEGGSETVLEGSEIKQDGLVE